MKYHASSIVVREILNLKWKRKYNSSLTAEEFLKCSCQSPVAFVFPIAYIRRFWTLSLESYIFPRHIHNDVFSIENAQFVAPNFYPITQIIENLDYLTRILWWTVVFVKDSVLVLFTEMTASARNASKVCPRFPLIQWLGPNSQCWSEPGLVSPMPSPSPEGSSPSPSPSGPSPSPQGMSPESTRHESKSESNNI